MSLNTLNHPFYYMPTGNWTDDYSHIPGVEEALQVFAEEAACTILERYYVTDDNPRAVLGENVTGRVMRVRWKGNKWQKVGYSKHYPTQPHGASAE